MTFYSAQLLSTNQPIHAPRCPAPQARDALADRDRRIGRFPEDFAWIHGHDAMETARRARPDGAAQAAA